MNNITLNQIEKIDSWMQENARAVDLSKWNYVNDKGSKNKIVNEMLKYQNNDGGFGNGLEADILLPLSAAIPSAEAIFIAYDYDLDCNTDWFKWLLDYFERTLQDTPSFWEKIPKETENYSHAPWWNYNPDTKFSANPCAVVASAMIQYGTDKQKDIGNCIAKKCIEILCSNEDCADHDIYNLIPLVEALQRIHSPLINDEVIKAMGRRIMTNVCFDESKWMEYNAQPLDIIDNPNSQWIDLVHNGIDNNFKFWMNNISNDGVWMPNFSWGNDSDTSRQVTQNWKGYMAVKRVRIFKNFNRISE